jgi:uncharacterized protein YecE (DUF72 family)
MAGPAASLSGRVRFGTAGWSYPDWVGPFYPEEQRRDFRPLVYYARYFDTAEINSSFYAIPAERSVRSWLGQTAEWPEFRFSAKLWRGFTHQRIATRGDVRRARQALGLLQSAGKLAALLLQFPWSFRPNPDNREYLDKLLEAFAEFDCVVEVRHQSWLQAGLIEWLHERGAGFCNIDQPTVARGLGPTAAATSELAYVRLHGRNQAAWFQAGETREPAEAGARYDYLYAQQELRPWAERIVQLMGQARQALVIANNHPRGQAAANALELKALVLGEPVVVPAPLLAAFPRLESITLPRK